MDPGYLSNVMHGNNPVSHEKILEFLGLERVEMYRRGDGGLL